jgi:hypothetical protein
LISTLSGSGGCVVRIFNMGTIVQAGFTIRPIKTESFNVDQSSSNNETRPGVSIYSAVKIGLDLGAGNVV